MCAERSALAKVPFALPSVTRVHTQRPRLFENGTSKPAK